MFFVKYFCAALVLDLTKYATVSAQYAVGKACVLKSGRGTCRIYDRCKRVYDDTKPPELLCGYEGGSPVVCCPNSAKDTFHQETTTWPIHKRPVDQYYAALLAQLEDTPEENYIGKSCVLKSGRGTCRFFERCKTAYDDNKPPELMCGYEDGFPVVCCPNSEKDNLEENVTRPIRKRPAEQACLKYAQEEPALRRTGPPVKLYDGSDYLDKKCHPPPTKKRHYIVGGGPAAPREYPHMAAIGFGTDQDISWKCGGSLISEDFVLTAAHCLGSAIGLPKYVRLGDLILNTTDDDARPQNRHIAKMIRYPDYKIGINYHDIALLKLDRPVTFDAYVRPACLSLEQQLSDDKLTIATGWGLTEDDEDATTNNLMMVELPIVPYANCSFHYTDFKEKLPNGLDDSIHVCAGGPNKDSCRGDSGGPLTVHSKHRCIYDIFGITSFGQLCGTSIPAVYTRVYKYLDWIESVVWPNLN